MGESTDLQQNREICDIRIDYNTIISIGILKYSKCTKYPKISSRISAQALLVNVFILLLFESLPDCGQNQTAVSDTLRSLSDFKHDQGCLLTVVNFYCV
jgi:hypothetical protein